MGVALRGLQLFVGMPGYGVTVSGWRWVAVYSAVAVAAAMPSHRWWGVARAVALGLAEEGEQVRVSVGQLDGADVAAGVAAAQPAGPPPGGPHRPDHSVNPQYGDHEDEQQDHDG